MSVSLAAPPFIELRALFPAAAITLVCGSWNRELAESLKLFDSIISCDYYKEDKRGGREASERILQAQLLGERLKGETFDLALDFRVPSDSRHLLQLVKARIRAGIGGSSNQIFLDIALPTLEALHSELLREVHEAANLSFGPKAFQYNPRTTLCDGLALCLATNEQFFIWGSRVNLDKGAYEGSLNLRMFDLQPESSVEVVFDFCTNNGGSVFFILIAPLSNSLLRDWPATEYVALARSLLARTTADIVLVGSCKQEGELLRMADEIGDDGQDSRLTVMAGRPWKDVISMIIGAQSTITNNSGLAHVAALLGARSNGIYSASHQTIEWGPVGENSMTIQADVECGPCGFDTPRECTNGHRCMHEISSADVLEALRKQCAGTLLEAQVDS
jgi:ADP-heptose:LPS heptosyltransferase